jgi:outer membrane protein
MKRFSLPRRARTALVLAATLSLTSAPTGLRIHAADPTPGTNLPATGAPTWPTGPLTLNDCLDLALKANPALRKGKQDIEESQGIALQQQSVLLPKLQSTGGYTQIDTAKIEKVQFAPGAPAVGFANPQAWNANLAVVQPLFAGGKLRSSGRSAKLTREAALSQYQSLVADTLLSVRIAYQDILLAAEQITTQEASVHLLEQELADTRRRFDAGTVPRFNVLRAEVELANAKPRLIRIRNSYRIAKNNLAVLLGFNVPTGTDQDIPLQTADRMTAEPWDLKLSDAILRGFGQRPELATLRTSEKLRAEEVRQAKGDYYPELSGTAGYGWQSRNFVRDLTQDLNGWNVGVQLNWRSVPPIRPSTRRVRSWNPRPGSSNRLRKPFAWPPPAPMPAPAPNWTSSRRRPPSRRPAPPTASPCVTIASPASAWNGRSAMA